MITWPSFALMVFFYVILFMSIGIKGKMNGVEKLCLDFLSRDSELFYILYWLSSRNFFGGGGQIYCYVNFFCYPNFSGAFGPNFRGEVSEGGKPPQGYPLPPTCGRKPV